MTRSLGPELRGVIQELDDCDLAADAVWAGLTPRQLVLRPGPQAWSVAECLAHLNLSSQAFLPLIKKELDRAAREQLTAKRSPRMDLLGRLLNWSLQPGRKFRTRTAEQFIPLVNSDVESILPIFHTLQKSIIELVEWSAAMDISSLKVRSPFDAKAKYNIYSAFRIIATHQKRHIAEAEAARSHIGM